MKLHGIVRCCVVALIAGFGFGLTMAHADVQPASVFTSHMVLQRNAKLPVWGTADVGESVNVSVGRREAQTTAGADGKWLVNLEPLVEPGPYTMTISGKNTITLEDVLAGEVWVCSGQSNMQWRTIQAQNGQQEAADATYPAIRLFDVPHVVAEQPKPMVQASWQVCDPKSAANFSAVAYFFGRELHKALGVPIGLIHSSWGGTLAQAWTPRPALEADAALRDLVPPWDTMTANYPAALAEYKEKLAAWEKAAQEAKAAGQPEPEKPKAPADPHAPARPAGLYNGMIAPLVPFAIRGVIWYQGESNATRAELYRTLFPTLIKSWRTNWNQGDFPFLFVQLSNYTQRVDHPVESFWAELREVQLQSLAIPRTGMAVTIDTNDAGDIHPVNKQDVGRRLALWALANEYGQKIEYSGPLYQGMKIEGNAIRISFTHAKGLKAGADGTLQSFAIAGEDRKFVWADAKIDGDSVVVSSPQVPQPVAVRYAWATNPIASLFNEAGLPASPFRTDNWERDVRNLK